MRLSGDLIDILLLGYLRKYAAGEARARTQGRIARDLQGLGLAVTARGVRDAVGRLVLAGWPIGSTCATPPGVFVCMTRADFLRAYRNLYIRVRGQARRCRRFKLTAREALSGQARFDFAEAEEKFHDIELAPLLGVGLSRGTVNGTRGAGRAPCSSLPGPAVSAGAVDSHGAPRTAREAVPC